MVDGKIRPIYPNESYFFEYSGELFKLYKTFDLSLSEVVNGFQILKADLVNKKWVSVKKLGRVAIFIDGHGDVQVLCASAESGITANSIYFLEMDIFENYYIYSLEKETIRMKPTFFSSMEMEITEATRLYWMHSDASFPRLLKGDQESICQNSEKEAKAIGEAEGVGEQNPWNMVPPELLHLIQLHLFGRDHAVFRIQCKSWQLASSPDYSIPSLLSSTALLELCQSISTPLLMFQEDLTISDDSIPVFIFFDPVHRKSYRMEIPELRETEIHHSRDGWLLVSRCSDGSIFFFNPLTREKIELPTNHIYKLHGYPHTLSFSSPPTCSNCFIVGVHHPTSIMSTLKQGEGTWRHEPVNQDLLIFFWFCPVVLNLTHFFMSECRSILTLSLMARSEGERPYHHMDWTELDPDRCSYQEDFFLEMDGALALARVDLGRGEISISKWNDVENDWELMEDGVDFRGKEMFLSRRSSFMKKIADAGELETTVFLPMVEEDAQEGVFYSMVTQKYHTFYSGYSSKLPYNVDKFLNGIWVEHDPKIIGADNLKWPLTIWRLHGDLGNE